MFLQAILKIIVQWWPNLMILARETEKLAILDQLYDENLIFWGHSFGTPSKASN